MTNTHDTNRTRNHSGGGGHVKHAIAGHNTMKHTIAVATLSMLVVMFLQHNETHYRGGNLEHAGRDVLTPKLNTLSQWQP
jgi:hypothetical protein